MSDRRIVIEHEDGRRLSVLEADFDVAERNPYNAGADVHELDANSGETVVRRRAARPLDDHQSLRAEGFKPVAYIHGESCDDRCEHEDVPVHAGNEIAL